MTMQGNTRLIFLFPVLCFLLAVNYSCNGERSEYVKLEKYYKENTVLHKNTSDSLIAFCQSNHTDVALRKSHYKESAISFQVRFPQENTLYPVFYDSALNRHDPYPEKTLKFSIPFSIIKNFHQSIYNGVSADSTQTFFGDKWDIKFRPGTQGDSQYGILLSPDTMIAKKCIIRLSANACISKGFTP